MAYLPKKARRHDIITADAWNAIQAELRRLGHVRVSGGLTMSTGPGGLALGVTSPEIARVAKTGPSGIAAMTGTSPGVGDVTLYHLGETLTAGGADVASNLATGAAGAVAGNTWIVVVRCDSRWLVISEICPA